MPDTDTTRYCEDCKFYTVQSHPGLSECRYPRKPGAVAMVVREPQIPPPRYCTSERGNETLDSCGAAAKWFEPRV